MADCDVCGSPLSSGSGGGAVPAWQAHLADFSDPHRTLDLVRGLIPRLTVGSASPDSTDDAKSGDWFVDLMAGTLWSCIPAQNGSLAWTKVADKSPSAQDLSAYATRAMLADYATAASLSGYLRPSDLSGYNFVTQSVLADALAPYATAAYVDGAVAGAPFLTRAAADARYVLAGTSAEYEYVTRTQLNAALGSYLESSVAAATYLTVQAADAADGFLRKSAPLPYVTPAQLTTRLAGYALTSSLSGFLTQTAADARYVQAGTGTGAAVTVGALNSALGSYLRTADAASTLGLSSYLTITVADGSSGFVRRTDFASRASAAGLVTSSQLANALADYALASSLSGFLTQSAADARYARAGTGVDAVVTAGVLSTALSSYLRTADAASTLVLSYYLTVAAADDPTTGFLRKADFATKATAAGLVFSSALNATLESYVTRTSVASIVDAKIAEVAETFATAEDLADLASSIAIEQGNGTALTVLEPDGGQYKPTARSNNLVVLTGSADEIPVLVPVRSRGAARDFILTVAFDRGTSMWTGTSFEVVPSTRQTETVQNRFFSATADVFEVDASLFDLDHQMVVFGFTEVADGRFLVSRKVVTEQGA